MKVVQSYGFMGTGPFVYTVELQESGISLINTKNGPGNSGPIPYAGAKIEVYSNVIGTANQLDFKPDLNNNFYWLVSDDVLTDRVTILDQGTLITPLVLDTGRYKGEFIFLNPNDYKYLYIVSDYTNNLPVTETVSYAYSAGDQIVIDAPLERGSSGVVSFAYSSTTGPFRIAIEYRNEIIADTGMLPGIASGTLTFVKTNVDDEDARIIVDNPSVTNTIDITSSGTALTSFYLDTTNGTLSNVCSQIATTLRRHNGSGSLPVAGDLIYTDVSGSTLYDGGNAYHVLSTVIMGAPSASSVYGSITSDGLITSRGSCTCSEIAVPLITQTDITVTQNQQVNVYVEVTNNPNSWELVTSCNEYSLEGGVSGAVFTYTDCGSVVKNVTVSRLQTQYVCASIAPTVVTGSGTVTLVGPCMENSLPEGLAFRDGFITGIPTTTGTTTIELIATNCFGDSINTTFDVIVESSVDLTPFAIDIDEPSVSGATACALTGTWKLLYHNGRADLPALNDTIFFDYKAVNRFVGGKMWYKVSGSLISYQIDEFGTVIDTHTC